ncbi:hypothetical protein, partial [Vibrio crassostreae]|uniref:hypothetical protein n=1 Tax=Vibrio crassostreae TaxID=246167 RepID=UPI001BD51FD1
ALCGRWDSGALGGGSSHCSLQGLAHAINFHRFGRSGSGNGTRGWSESGAQKNLNCDGGDGFALPCL